MVKQSKQTIETTWEVWTYDVWGNARDGYDVNDRCCICREYPITLQAKRNNAGTTSEFLSAYPTHKQIREALGLKRIQLELDGDDMTIYVRHERTGYPCGELICVSHVSLSPIKQHAQWEVIVGNIGSVYAGADEDKARRTYAGYVEQSVSGTGRAGNEDVTLLCDGDIVMEIFGIKA